MKKFLSVICPLAAIELSVALFFVLMQWPTGDLQTLIALCVATIALVCVAVYSFSRVEHKLTMIFSLASLWILMVGGVFHLCHFPGGVYMLAMAFCALIPVSAILWAVAFAKGE